MIDKSSKKCDDEEDKLELENQFILRLPIDDAKYVHKLLHEKPKKIKKNLKIQINDDMRNGIVYVKKKPLSVRLVDLPTIIESSKILNQVNIYKVATISQMLLAKNPDKDKKLPTEASKYLYAHGLTPPMKNVRKQKFRKTIKNHIDAKEAAEVQKEVALLLRTDNEAVAVKYELINCDKEVIEPEITENLLFGPMSSSDTEGSSSPTLYDIMEFNN